VAPKKEEKKKKEKSAKKSVDDILEDLNCGRDEEVKRLSSIIGRGKTNRGGIVVVTGTCRGPLNCTPMGADPTSPAHLHVCSTGRTCG